MDAKHSWVGAMHIGVQHLDIRSISGKIIENSSQRQKCKQKLLAFSIIRQPREPCASTRLHMRAGALRRLLALLCRRFMAVWMFSSAQRVTERNLVASARPRKCLSSS
jgi:hypothetical protein